jgi:hypothetical protein
MIFNSFYVTKLDKPDNPRNTINRAYLYLIYGIFFKILIYIWVVLLNDPFKLFFFEFIVPNEDKFERFEEFDV